MSTGNKRKQHTNSVTGEPGNKEHKAHSHIGSSQTHKKRKTETTPREGYCKIKIQCACDGCNKKISPKLEALKAHHKTHHNAVLSIKVPRKLHKGEFMEN